MLCVCVCACVRVLCGDPGRVGWDGLGWVGLDGIQMAPLEGDRWWGRCMRKRRDEKGWASHATWQPSGIPLATT